MKKNGDNGKKRTKGIPANPDVIYKDKGWKGYVDFLGKEK